MPIHLVSECFSLPRASSAKGEAKPQADEAKPQVDEAKPQAPRVIEVKPHAGEAEAPVQAETSVADVVEVIEMVEAAHEVSLELLDDVDVCMNDCIAAHHERRITP